MSVGSDTMVVMCDHEHLECPNGLDCHSFCSICEGNGEYCPMGCEMQYDEESGDIVYINLDACRLGCVCKEDNE